jgi:hypothetical protein
MECRDILLKWQLKRAGHSKNFLVIAAAISRLGRNGWKDAEIYVYEAIVFNEKEF